MFAHRFVHVSMLIIGTCRVLGLLNVSRETSGWWQILVFCRRCRWRLVLAVPLTSRWQFQPACYDSPAPMQLDLPPMPAPHAQQTHLQ